jgi:hypothetical protein
VAGQPLAKRQPGTPLSEAELRQRREAARARWAAAAAGAGLGAAAGALAGAEAADRLLGRRVLRVAQRKGLEAQQALEEGRARVARWSGSLVGRLRERQKWVQGSGLAPQSPATRELQAHQMARAMPQAGARPRPLSPAAQRAMDFGHLPTVGTPDNRQVLDLIERRMERRLAGLRRQHDRLDQGFETADPRRLRALSSEVKRAEEALASWRARRAPGSTMVAPTTRTARDGTIRVVRAHAKATYRGGAGAEGRARAFTTKDVAELVSKERAHLAERTGRAVASVERVARARTARSDQAVRQRLRQDTARLTGWALKHGRRWRLGGAAAGALAGAGLGLVLAVRRRDEPAAKVDQGTGLAKAVPRAVEDVVAEAMIRLWQRWRRQQAHRAARAAEAQAAAESGDAPSDDDLDRVIEPLDDAFMEGARSGMSELEPSGGSGRPRILAVSFDLRNPQVERELQRYRLDLIREITQEQTESVRRILLQGTAEGRPPAQMARDIRETVGLTQWQAAQVQRYRRQLETLDISALRRELRDRRYDGTVQRAVRDGRPLTEAQVDRMVAAYHRRFMAYRAMTVARTEGIRATNLGNIAAARAWLAENPGMTVVKTWVATKDERTRDAHRELDGRSVVGIDTPFVLSDGRTIRHPHDPEADADMVINCLLPGARVFAPAARSVSRREYKGEAIAIETIDGAQLSCTINHPILTTRGWIAAQFIQETDSVVSAADAHWNALVNDDQHAPPKIEDLEHAFDLIGSARLQVVRAVDFHREGMTGQVRIVTSDRHLIGHQDAALAHPVSEKDLLGRGLVAEQEARSALFLMPGRGPGCPPNRSMSVSHLGMAALLGHLRPFQPLSLTACPGSAMMFAEHAGDDVPRDAILIRQILHRAAAIVGCEENGEVRGSPTLAGIPGVSTPLMRLSRIARVSRFRYHGDVYNTQTDSGLYIANGIVNHNCRCTIGWMAVPRERAPLAAVAAARP